MTLYAVTLCRAAAIVGGHAQLAALLGVRRELLARWTAGAEPAPIHVFLRAVDIVLAERMRAIRGHTCP